LVFGVFGLKEGIFEGDEGILEMFEAYICDIKIAVGEGSGIAMKSPL
jgi:hypothetical protein